VAAEGEKVCELTTDEGEKFLKGSSLAKSTTCNLKRSIIKNFYMPQVGLIFFSTDELTNFLSTKEAFLVQIRREL